MTDRRTDGRTDRTTDGRPGKNNMSPNPSGGDIMTLNEKKILQDCDYTKVCLRENF